MNRHRSLSAAGAAARAMLTPTFWAGALASAGLMLCFFWPPSAGDITAAEVVPVRGDDSAEAHRHARLSVAANSIASKSSTLSPRELARRALAITVFVKGGGMYGAGFAISNRHVLTCLHVVENLQQVEVSVEQRPTAHARVVERDKRLDLAVLELDAPMRLEPARLASASTAHMGDPVYAMGAPRKMSFSFSAGIVSHVDRSYDGVHFLQADLPSNSGSSGGPWLDAAGRVVAISSFILRDSQGLAFALPIEEAYRRFSEYFANGLDEGSSERRLDRRVTLPRESQAQP